MIIKVSKTILFVFALMVAACSQQQEMSSSPKFLHKAAEALGHAETVSLKDYTDFSWSEMCFFKQMDSAPESAFIVYSEYLLNNSIPAPLLPKKNYALIIIVKSGDDYIQYHMNRAAFRIQGKDSFYRLEGNSRLSQSAGCFGLNAKITRSKFDELIISEEGK